MSVILEALQKARVDSTQVGPATSRVVDVPPPRGVKLRGESPARMLWVMASLVIMFSMMGAAGVGIYWVMQNKERFTFGLSPKPVSGTDTAPAASVEVAKPISELPPPVALETVKAPVAPSQHALPPPPVAAAGNIGAPSTTPVAPAAVVASEPQFSLGTIICGDANDCAGMVNGRTVRRGDMVRDHRVVEITPTEVRLQRGSEAPVILSLVR